MEIGPNTFPLRPLSRTSDDSYNRGHEHEHEHEHERAPPSPLLQPTPASEADAFLQPRRSSSVSDQEHHGSDVAKKPPSRPPPSTTLHRSAYVLILVLLYAGLAVFAWVVTCILTFRPITAKHYGAWIFNKGNNGYGWVSPKYIPSLFAKNQRWYRAARVLQSIVSVLTIPLTSAVCSSAAVIFVQHNQKSFGLSIRQVMTLADKGWTDPATYARTFLTWKGWKRYGSSCLLLAMLLSILGGVISPLQEVFLSTKTIKIPTWPQMILELLDIPDQWHYANEKGSRDNNLIVVMTRSALTTATNTQPQAQLWQGAGFTCDTLKILDRATNGSSDGAIPSSCGKGATFGNVSVLNDPFLAELPSGYNTGLILQFIPRINSTARYEVVSAAEYPTDCDTIHGAFSVNYGNVSTADNYTQGWSLQACMPADLRQSPWRSTRDRQDFSEELYINVTMIGYANWQATPAGGSLYRVTVNTTAGYFELPNYMNGGVVGPLLATDPNSLCGADCEMEGLGSNFIPDIYDHNIPNKTRRQVTSDDPAGSLALEQVFNKGPLLTTAMALFGEGSFLANRIAWPQAYSGLNYTRTSSPANAGACIDMAPLGFLLADEIGQNVIGNSIDICIRNTDGGIASSDLQYEIAGWIENFQYDTERLTNAFTAAAFLANQAWMLHNDQHSLTVSYDLGVDTEVPVISEAGIILISALLGLDLLALLSMAVYACLSPRWTNQLDAFTMMRLGAAMADKVPLMVGRRTDKIKVLDEIPGWIGDVAERDEEIGRLGLGAPVKVNRKRRYMCYDGDKEVLSMQEQKASRERLKEMREQGLAQGLAGVGATALDTVGIRT